MFCVPSKLPVPLSRRRIDDDEDGQFGLAQRGALSHPLGTIIIISATVTNMRKKRLSAHLNLVAFPPLHYIIQWKWRWGSILMIFLLVNPIFSYCMKIKKSTSSAMAWWENCPPSPSPWQPYGHNWCAPSSPKEEVIFKYFDVVKKAACFFVLLNREKVYRGLVPSFSVNLCILLVL